MEKDQAEQETYAEILSLIEQETCTDILNLPLREWVLAYLVYLRNRTNRNVPTAARPYRISRDLRKPVWAVEKSLRSLVQDGLAREIPLGPFSPRELYLIQRLSRANPSIIGDWLRGEWLRNIRILYGDQVTKLVQNVQSGRQWPCEYYVTSEGQEYLESRLMLPVDYNKYEDHEEYWELVFDWLRDRTEPRVLWLPSVPNVSEAIRAGGSDWSESASWEPVRWGQIDSHLEMLSHPKISARLRESMIWRERWERLHKSRKHARVQFGTANSKGSLS